MRIEVLVCHPDGRQELVQREVAKNWFDVTPLPAPLTKDEIPIQ